jgi:nicotinate phosphoribosyltransferase
VGAVAKLGLVNGRPTMKLSRGSGKATLPGRLQVFRTDEGDIIGLSGEFFPGRPLLERVWEGEFCCIDTDLLGARQRAQRELAALPAASKEPRDASLRLSPALVALITKLCSSGG